MGVVVAERRFVVEIVLESDELPADLIFVAAQRGIAEEAGQREAAENAEGRRRLHRLHYLDLLRRSNGRKRFRARDRLCDLLVKGLESVLHRSLLIAVDRAEHIIGEVNHIGLARAGCLVGGEYLRRESVEVGRLLRSEEAIRFRPARARRLRVSMRLRQQIWRQRTETEQAERSSGLAQKDAPSLVRVQKASAKEIGNLSDDWEKPYHRPRLNGKDGGM